MTQRSSRRAGLVAVLAVGALIAVAAASAGSKAGTPIKLMVIAPVATPIQNYPDAQAGAQAAAAAINKAGGIKGRQIEITFCNTQSQANVAVGCARQAVDDKATAVVGHISTLSTLEEPILQQANIPDVGFFSSGNPIDWTNPNMFPMVGGSVAAYMSLPFAMKKLGMKRFVISYQDVPSAATNAKLAKNAAKVAGLNVAGTILLPGSTTDFAPYAQKLRELNPDSVMFINSPGVSGGLMRAATSLGVKPLWSHNTGSIGEAEASQIGAPADGMVLGGTAPTFRDTTYPGIRKFVADMKAAGKDDPSLMKAVGVNGWLSVYAVAAIAKNVKGNLDNVSLLAALRKQKKPIDLFGLVSFSPGASGPAAFPRWSSIKEYFETVKNGQVVAYGAKLPPVYPLVLQHYVR
jgi:ABC-type branched-subunit amino acid transport system substrate-binding protein